MNQVVLKKCLTYDLPVVKEALRESLGLLGGLDSFLKPGQKVMLKANLLMKKLPEEATTTHPIFMQAIAELMVEFGLQVVIADSPGGPFNVGRLRSLYAYCGYADLESIKGVTLNYNVESKDIQTPQCKTLKRMSVLKALDDVDYVVSVSKLKTHGMMRFTGAVKNMFGIIPGVQKAEYHFTLPKLNDFADGLIDICLAGKPVLSLMDGIVAMEGHGPSAGTPKPMGVVLASPNPFALDQVACRLIGLGVKDVPVLAQALERGLISEQETSLDLLGDPIPLFYQKDFVIPKVRGISFFDKAPAFIRPIVEKQLKPNPVFDHDLCVGCGDCAANCPPRVIEMQNHKPIVNLKGCIRCFCCQELCPVKAVKIKRSWFLDKIVKM